MEKFTSLAKTAGPFLKNIFLRFWKRLSIIGGAVIVGLFAVYLVLPSPTAQGSLKGHEVNLTANASIMIAFDRAMNKKSVEKAFRVSPYLNGTFTWNDNLLTFKPERDFEKGQRYEVVIDEHARSTFFKPLSEAYRQTFNILDYPEVVVNAPADQSVISQNQTLTVLVDHPLRVLNDDLSVPDELLVLDPPVNGEMHWLGTSGFEFVPETEWPPATVVTAMVPKGTPSADGGATVEDKTWTFRTAALSAELVSRVQHHLPADPIRIQFNYPVNPAVIQVGLHVSEAELGQEGRALIPNDLTVVLDKDDATTVLVFRKGGYRLGMSYEFKMDAGFTANVGPLGLETEWIRNLTMDERQLRVNTSDPLSGEKKGVSDAVVICLNNPPDEETLKNAITVTPALEDMQVSPYGYTTRCWGEGAFSVYGSWKPSTAYAVSVSTTLADVYGQHLQESYVINFETNPYQPSVEISTYSSQGVLASHLPRLYQVRTRNWDQPFTAGLESISPETFMKDVDQVKPSPEFKKTYEAPPNLNAYKIFDVDFDDVAGSRLQNGFYLLSFSGSFPQYTNVSSKRVVITDTALTLKRDRDGHVLVWATDLVSGDVVPGLSVEVWKKGYNTDVKQLGRSTTDAQGVAELDLGENFRDVELAVVAKNETHLGYVESSWVDGISPWNFSLERNYSQFNDSNIGHVYTDRRIYRPDHTVYFKAVVRHDRDAMLTLPKSKEAHISINDSEGRTVWEQDLPINDFGTVNGQLQLSPEMSLGTYGISLSVKGEEQYGYIYGAFDVLEYRRPDFEVTVGTPQEAVAGQTISVPIRGAYYQGIPLKDARVDYSITRTRYYFQPFTGPWFGKWFSFDEIGSSSCYWYCYGDSQFEAVQSGSLTLDGNGDALVSLPANLTDYKGSATYTMNVTVTDVNQRQVSSRNDFVVHKGSYYLGIRPDYSSGWNAPNADFEIASVNRDNSTRSGVTATVKFYSRDWSNVKKDNASGGTYYEWTSTDTLIDTKGVATNAQGQAFVSFSPDADGSYVAVVEAYDEGGRRISASTTRYVYRGRGGTVRATDDYIMNIVQDKGSYQVGDTASLAVQTPYQSTKALVTVERNTIREHRIVDLGTSNQVVDVAITDTSTPNVYVSVTAVHGGGADGLPEFRQAYANLQVDTEKKVLGLQITADKAVYKPGDEVSLQIEANKSDGAPVEAEVSIAVVDERIIALLGEIDRNILGTFWFPRTIGVDTSQTLTHLVKRIYVTTEGGAGGKGGDDSPEIRGNFLDTAYWNATVRTDTNGKATVHFSLPDNLTKWNILAVGETKDTIVGTADTSIISRRDLMAEPLMPRILRHGDTAEIGATIINGTSSAMDVDVQLAAEGVQLDGGTKRIYIGANDRAVATWTARVPQNLDTEATFTLTARGNGLADGFTVPLPILDYSVPEVVSASGILEKNVTETVELPDDILQDRSDVRINVQPNIGNGLQDSIDYLVSYPYGCSEQRTSSLLANLVFAELARLQVGSDDAEKIAEAETNVRDSIKLLVSMQRYDGGWGFWNTSDRSYPWLSAYVFWGLTQAEKAGYPVDSAVMARADGYLRGALANTNYPYWNLSDSERAQVVFMLSERDPSGLNGYADALYERRDTLPAFANLYLAMAYQNMSALSSTDRPKTLIGEARNHAVYLNPSTLYLSDDAGYGDLLSTDLRSTSIYLQALLRIDPKHEDIERSLRYLMENRTGGYWYTTQNTAMTLLGVIEYAKAHPVDASSQSVQVFIDNALKETLRFEKGDVSGAEEVVVPVAELSDAGAFHQIGLEKESETRYFYDIDLRLQKEIEAIEPFDNGMAVIADVFAFDDEKYAKPLSSLKAGETARVRMKLLVPKRRRYVAFEYHLPAGLEAVDFTLQTSPQELAGKVSQCYPGWNGKQRCLSDWELGWWWANIFEHIEYRDDRVFLFADTLEPGVYEYEFVVQALTPGTYRVPPARAYEFYNPLSNSHNEGKIFRVAE